MLSRILRGTSRTVPAPTRADVAYGGDCPRQKLDFWSGAPADGKPCPALVFFHGGGFVRGSKYYCRQMRESQRQGAAAIAVNYRFVRSPRSTVALPMADGLRALDFIRNHAADWNIDPDRIALTGKSSGGCIALWLGMKETVRGVTTHNAPTSLQPEHLVEIGKRPIEAFWPIWAPMSGTYLTSGLHSERVRGIIRDYSPIHHVHPASPPLHMRYTAEEPAHGIGWLHTLHCVRYGELMKERYDALGLSCEIDSPARPASRSAIGFLAEVLELHGPALPENEPPGTPRNT